VADPGRPAVDKQRDENRKPAETVQFAGLRFSSRCLSSAGRPGSATAALM